MKVIKNELMVACDVDDTILMWDNPTVNGPGKLAVSFAGGVVYLTPHHYHVDLLRMYKERGYHVTVWSANGWRHAERACKVLGIEDVVDVVQCKLMKHMDDNPNAESVIGPRVFCQDLTKPPSSSGTLIIKSDGLIPMTGGISFGK